MGGHRRRQKEDDIPEIYKEMLAEVAASTASDQASNESGSRKRRKIATRRRSSNQHELVSVPSGHTVQNDRRPVRKMPASLEGGVSDQTRSRDITPNEEQEEGLVNSKPEDSAESDVGWENVDLVNVGHDSSEPSDEDSKTTRLNLVLDEEDTSRRRRAVVKAKSLSAAQRQSRLEIHRMHIMCLLVHVGLRNHWCNNFQLKVELKSHIKFTEWVFTDAHSLPAECPEAIAASPYPFIPESRAQSLPVSAFTLFYGWSGPGK